MQNGQFQVMKEKVSGAKYMKLNCEAWECDLIKES